MFASFHAHVIIRLHGLDRVEAVFPGLRRSSSFLCQEICARGRFCCSYSEVMLYVCVSVMVLAPFKGLCFWKASVFRQLHSSRCLCLVFQLASSLGKGIKIIFNIANWIMHWEKCSPMFVQPIKKASVINILWNNCSRSKWRLSDAHEHHLITS